MILLDSHAPLRVFSGRRPLEPKASAALAASDAVHVSAATLLDLAMNHPRGADATV